MSNRLVAPSQDDFRSKDGSTDAFRSVYQFYGLLVGQSAWGAPISLTGYDDDAAYAVTLFNGGAAGKHLNIPGVLTVDASGVTASLLAASILHVTGFSLFDGDVTIGDSSGDLLTVNATSTFKANLTVQTGGGAVLARFDISNLRVLIGSATPLSGATDDKLSVIGGAAWVASNNSDVALGMRYGVLGQSWTVGATGLTDPDMIFRDGATTEVFRLGDASGSAYQAKVTGAFYTTNGATIAGNGLLLPNTGITLSGPGNIDGNGGTAGQLRIGAVIVNTASLLGTEVLRVHGDMLVEGSISSTGAIGATAGQIAFPAVQNPSANANTLDDYEEGTWTPSLGGSATYTTQSGAYIKIGRVVCVWCSLTVNAIGTGSTGTISGLPFAADTYSGGSVGTWASLALSPVFLAPLILNGTTTAEFEGATAAAASLTTPLAIFGSGATVRWSAVYRTAS